MKVYYQRKESKGWVISYKGIELSDIMTKDMVEQKIQAQSGTLLHLEAKEVFW